MPHHSNKFRWNPSQKNVLAAGVYGKKPCFKRKMKEKKLTTEIIITSQVFHRQKFYLSHVFQEIPPPFTKTWSRYLVK